MSAPDPTGATAAATVIIARDGAGGLEVLAIERASGMGFAGGAIAFPGGKVDAADSPEGPCFAGFGGLDPTDATGRVTAAREAFEEAGILLSAGPPVEAGLRRRFDTLFFVAALPPGEVMLADGHEAVKAHWARPADLLAEADAGRSSLMFPTRCNIARLALFGTVEALLADRTPPPFVQPEVSGDGWLTIPEGVGYPYTRERLESVRRT